MPEIQEYVQPCANVRLGIIRRVVGNYVLYCAVLYCVMTIGD